MAGTDELIYRVRLEVDDNSYEETKRQLKELHELQKESSTGDAMEGTKEFTEVMEAFNKSNAEGIERLIELQEAIDGYTATLGELRQAKKSEEGVTKEQRAEEVKVAAALKDSRQEYRDYQKELIANTNATRTGNRTYNQMTAELKILRAELQNIPLNDTTGKLEKQREAVRVLTEDLKTFDKSIGDNRRNVGNYSETLSVAASAVAAFQGPLGPIAGRMTSINSTISRTIPLLRSLVVNINKVKLALITTGIGAAIVALGTLIASLKTVQTVGDDVAKKWDQIKAVTSALTTTWLRFVGVTDATSMSMREAWETAGDLYDRQVKLEEIQLDSIVTHARLEVAIAKARREAEEEERTYRSRLTLIEEAIANTNELIDSKIREAEETHRLAVENANIAESKRDELLANAELEAELIKLNADRNMQIRQLQRRSTSLTNQMRIEAEQREREIEQIRKQIQALGDLSIKKAQEAMETESIRLQKQRTDRRIELLREENLIKEALELEMHQKRLQAEREFEKARLEIEENVNKKAVELAKLYQMEGMSAQEATEQAVLEAKAFYAERKVELEQALADRVEGIAEDHQANLEDYEQARLEVQKTILDQVGDLRAEREMAQLALQRALRGEGHQEMLLLEEQENARRLELQAEYLEKFGDAETASRLAQEQAELEFYKQKEQTMTEILARELETRLGLEEGYAEIAIGLMTTMFGDTKAIRVATAIIDTYTAANRQLATGGDGPLAFVRAGAAIAMGLANIRTILDTKVGDTGGGRSGSGSGGGASASAPLGFETIDRTVDEGAIARQVAEGAKSEQQEINPTFIFTGDLDPEVMSIKVKQGDRMINTKTITTQSV